MGKIGLGVAVLLLILWGGAMLLICPPTEKPHDPWMETGAATPAEGEGRLHPDSRR